MNSKVQTIVLVILLMGATAFVLYYLGIYFQNLSKLERYDKKADAYFEDWEKFSADNFAKNRNYLWQHSERCGIETIQRLDDSLVSIYSEGRKLISAKDKEGLYSYLNEFDLLRRERPSYNDSAKNLSWRRVLKMYYDIESINCESWLRNRTMCRESPVSWRVVSAPKKAKVGTDIQIQLPYYYSISRYILRYADSLEIPLLLDNGLLSFTTPSCPSRVSSCIAELIDKGREIDELMRIYGGYSEKPEDIIYSFTITSEANCN